MYGKRYFLPASDGKYRGIRAGLPKEVVKDTYTKDELFSVPNVTNTTNVVWMRASEVSFLKAEAALRWPDLNLGGNAQFFYEEGVRKSFEEQGVSGADDYLSNEELKPAAYEDPVTSTNSADPMTTLTVAWKEGDGFQRKLERIITQKYIALYPVGQEAWTDFRRTGYPKVFPVVSNESSGNCVNTNLQIRRLPYPRSEYDTNRVIVEAGVKLLDGPDNAGTRVWWNE